MEFVYCNDEGPEESTRGGKYPVVRCSLHEGHTGDTHRNGTWEWPRYECDGRCVYVSDLGLPYDGLAHADPSCSLHGPSHREIWC